MPAEVAQCIAGDSKVHRVQPINLEERSREQRTMVDGADCLALQQLPFQKLPMVQPFSSPKSKEEKPLKVPNLAEHLQQIAAVFCQ